MARIARFSSYCVAAAILAGAALCGWAYLESLKPNLSSEILMVIGTLSFLMLVAGGVLVGCMVVAHREMAMWEWPLLGAIALLGVGLLPILGLFGF